MRKILTKNIQEMHPQKNISFTIFTSSKLITSFSKVVSETVGVHFNGCWIIHGLFSNYKFLALYLLNRATV